jgi:serine/threonine protein kinase
MTGAGETCPLSFSIRYAAPEVAAAFERGENTIVADPAADMWALGVIAYELITNSPVFGVSENRESALHKIIGRGSLPWEHPDPEVNKLSKLRRLRGTILACLSRDASQRPASHELLNAWERFFDATEVSGNMA